MSFPFTNTGSKKYDPKSIRDLRTKNGLSQETFAGAIGVHQTAVSAWETGRVIPGADMIARMSEVFLVPESFFFTFTD